MKSIDLKTWVVWSLRKASYRWPPRQRALAAAKVTVGKNSMLARAFPRCRNFYQCKECEGVFNRKMVSIDHIEPVVDPQRGFQGFDEYIARMFVQVDGFQIICNKCHDKKTANERGIRLSAKNEEKTRMCEHCKVGFKTTAKGIKEHAKACPKKTK